MDLNETPVSLFPKMFRDVDAEWTSTIVIALNHETKPTLKTAGFKTHQMMIKADIVGLA